MAVKTVTDHESAVVCCTELDNFLKKMPSISSRLLREVLPQESPEKINALRFELRRRLLPGSEHWKAEAHRLARKVPRTRGSSPSKKQMALGVTQTPPTGEVDSLARSLPTSPPSSSALSTSQDLVNVGKLESTSAAVRIMRAAMHQQGLNATEACRENPGWSGALRCP
jgi:hypothetical protein